MCATGDGKRRQTYNPVPVQVDGEWKAKNPEWEKAEDGGNSAETAASQGPKVQQERTASRLGNSPRNSKVKDRNLFAGSSTNNDTKKILLGG